MYAGDIVYFYYCTDQFVLHSILSAYRRTLHCLVFGLILHFNPRKCDAMILLKHVASYCQPVEFVDSISNLGLTIQLIFHGLKLSKYNASIWPTYLSVLQTY